jgi:hypothetical protein
MSACHGIDRPKPYRRGGKRATQSLAAQLAAWCFFSPAKRFNSFRDVTESSQIDAIVEFEPGRKR